MHHRKRKSLLTVLEIALEMCERGFSFAKPDLYKSDATTFLIDGNSLIPPFNSIPSLGTNVANTIVEARKDGEFLVERGPPATRTCFEDSY